MSFAGNTFIYDTNVLIAVVPNLKKAQSFLVDMFFSAVVDPESEKVSIDIDVGKRRMSPFVSPLVEGQFVEQRRYQTNEFKPAYIKDKRAPDLRKPIRRMIGERIGGEPAKGPQREMANLMFEMEDQVDMVQRRLEWMAAQVLMTGTLLVQGSGFEPVTIDFGRSSRLTIDHTGAAQWGQAGVSPASDIEAWQKIILQESGAVVNNIIFTTTPWEFFLQDPLVKGAVFYPKLSEGNTINPGAQIVSGAIYKGRWGNYDLWVYNDWYVDSNNAEQEMLPDGQVLMTGALLMGLRAFGQILDPVHQYQAMAFAPKTWIREDPAQRFMMMQSAPLTIPSRVNASLGATVCAGET